MTDAPSLQFVIPGQPLAWERVDTGRYGQQYVPNRTRRHESDVWTWAMDAGARRGMFQGPVLLGVQAFIRHKTKTGPNDRRPDLDNIVKAIKDGLAPIWRDDSQVVGYIGFPWSGKLYSSRPRTVVIIRPPTAEELALI